MLQILKKHNARIIEDVGSYLNSHNYDDNNNNSCCEGTVKAHVLVWDDHNDLCRILKTMFNI